MAETPGVSDEAVRKAAGRAYALADGAAGEERLPDAPAREARRDHFRAALDALERMAAG